MQTQHVHEPQQGYEPPNSPALPDEPYYQQPAAANNDRRRMGLALLVIGFLWLLIEFNGMGFIFSGNNPTDTRLHLPTAPSQIELNLGSGDVDIVVGQSDEIEIVVDYEGRWQGEFLQHSQVGDRLTVENNARRGRMGFCFGRCGLNYHVSIPADSQLVLQTSSGDIVVKGNLDQPEIKSTSGDIRLENAQLGASIVSTSGDIRLNHVAGPIEIKTTSGDINMNDGRIADSQAESISGDIELNGVVGELRASTTSGDITITQIQQGQLNLRSMSGDLYAEGELVGSSIFESTSGDVDLRLAADSNLTLNVETLSGEIDAPELDNQQASQRELRGQLGDGSATVSISTTSGDIEIK